MLAQVSIEFISLVSILFVLMIFVVYYSANTHFQINSVKIFNEAQGICDQIASEINFALKAGDGYSRIFYLPTKILNAIDYTISVENYLVTVSWEGSSTHSVILTKNITGNFLKGRNLIKNLGGLVYVNQ